MDVYQAQEVREIDRVTIEEHGVSGLTLMKRAAAACVEVLMRRHRVVRKAAVICGSGNNAGDGFIIAGMLANKGINVAVSLVGRSPESGTDAGEAFRYCEQSSAAFLSVGEALKDADVIVDALLGTGITGDVRENFASAIDAINAHSADVLAVDIPSGLSADTGKSLSHCVRADTTVTFIANKLGLLTCDGPEFVGDLVLNDLGVDLGAIPQVRPCAKVLSLAVLQENLVPRHRNAHKVNHGHVLVLGGNEGMAGAVSMAAESALTVGAGMVTAATYPGNEVVVVTRSPEIMARGVRSQSDLLPMIERAGTIVVGPGLGRNDWAGEMLTCALESGKPLVIDADGLTLLAALDVQPGSSSDWVLTPHPGEAARLLDISSPDVQADRLSAVRQLHANYSGVILLKGAGTLIQGSRTTLCPYGNPGMSVAGMGDVLSGIIGGLWAQGLDPETATQLGAVIHSSAADTVVAREGERGLFATSLLPEVRVLANRKND